MRRCYTTHLPYIALPCISMRYNTLALLPFALLYTHITALS